MSLDGIVPQALANFEDEMVAVGLAQRLAEGVLAVSFGGVECSLTYALGLRQNRLHLSLRRDVDGIVCVVDLQAVMLYFIEDGHWPTKVYFQEDAAIPLEEALLCAVPLFRYIASKKFDRSLVDQAFLATRNTAGNYGR